MQKQICHFFLYSTAILLLFLLLWTLSGCKSGKNGENNAQSSSEPPLTDANTSELPPATTPAPEPVPEPIAPPPQVTEGSGSEDISTSDNLPAIGYDAACFNNTLFIGDSRTVGLKDYANLGDADIFASSGMNVFRIFQEPVSVPGKGQIMLCDLLSSRAYNKIYIMLGINEIGYSRDMVVKYFGKLVEQVQTAQPNAKIYIQANLAIQKNRSDRDAIYNNANLAAINEGIATFANGSCVIYLDANPLFGDGAGNLASAFAIDDFHLLGKYYQNWAAWLCEKTA